MFYFQAQFLMVLTLPSEAPSFCINPIVKEMHVVSVVIQNLFKNALWDVLVLFTNKGWFTGHASRCVRISTFLKLVLLIFYEFSN